MSAGCGYVSFSKLLTTAVFLPSGPMKHQIGVASPTRHDKPMLPHPPPSLELVNVGTLRVSSSQLT